MKIGGPSKSGPFAPGKIAFMMNTIHNAGIKEMRVAFKMYDKQPCLVSCNVSNILMVVIS